MSDDEAVPKQPKHGSLKGGVVLEALREVPLIFARDSVPLVSEFVVFSQG